MWRCQSRPAEATAATGAALPLRAIARYADGSSRDVTALALYESNDRVRAGVDAEGRVTIGDLRAEGGPVPGTDEPAAPEASPGTSQ